ncbi:DUF977 family protein [Patescibacteria group bacterium]|nr:DUF977 family protein [Patescibacteria group bacterium]
MTLILSLALGVVVGLVLALILVKVESKKSPEAINQKEQNLQKVWAMFADQEQVTNNNVEELLGVSDATAERYLNELEQQGKIKQIGQAGQGVYYKKL